MKDDVLKPELGPAWSERTIGNALCEEGEVRRALEHLRKALRLFEEHDAKVWVAHTHLDIGRVLTAARKIEHAKRHYTLAVLLFEQIENLEGLLVADYALAELAEKRRDRKARRFHLSKALATSRKLNVNTVGPLEKMLADLDRPAPVTFGKGVNHRGQPR